MVTARMTGSTMVLVAATFIVSGCVSPKGDTPNEKRAAAQQMRTEALSTFYTTMPQMRKTLEAAPGYGVFSGVGTQSIIMASGQGWGIIRDNQTHKDYYMSALKLGGGLGVGVVDVRAIVVFHDSKVLYDAIHHGWSATGKAEAAAKVGQTGEAGALVINLPGMTIYRFTKNGAMLGGAIEGVKIWQDEELN